MRRLLALAPIILVAACSSQSTQPPASPSPTRTVAPTACEELIAALPRNLDGDPLIETTATSAVWGTPRMQFDCDVAVPEEYKRTSEIYVINDVSWFAQEQPEGFLFTGVGREPLVSIYVPNTHTPEVNPLVDLAPVMTEWTEVTGPAAKG